MKRVLPALTSLAIVPVLAGCVSRGPQDAPPVVTAGPAVAVAAPAGIGDCGAEIARVQRILAQDLDMGHVNRSVYDRMTPPIARAAERCRAGDQAGARAMLASVKRAHGYY